MFETSGAGEEGWSSTPPPPAADRLWRHPSEMAARAPAPSPSGTVTEHRPHRFSLGTVVVASSLGALAMFGTLAATGLIGGPTGTATTGSQLAGVTGTADAAVTTTAPPGVVAVRFADSDTTTFGAGIVFNSAGDVVTTLRTTAHDGAVPGTISIETDDAAWSVATIVGSDPVTGLTVLHADGARRSAAAVVADTAVVAPDLGQSIDMVRPGVGAIGARFRSGTATRVTGTNSTIGSPATTFVGLLTLTSSRPATAAEVGVDPTTGAVAALVVPSDDDPEDEMTYAIPADLAVTVGRQIDATGQALHGALDAALTVTPTDGLVVVSAPATATGLSVGDEVLSVDGRPVHDTDDVAGALLGVSPGETVAVMVRRDNRQRSFAVAAVPRPDQVAVSTTTLP